MKILEKCNKKQKDLQGVAPVNLVVFGDSVTQGCFECYKTSDGGIQTVFDAENAYGAKLKKMLNVLYPQTQINLINSGISGDWAGGGLNRLNRDVLKYSPDLVVVGFALNDACVYGRERIGEYEETLTSIVKKIKNAGSECILLTPNYMCTEVSCHISGEEVLKNAAENFAIIQNDGVLDDFVEVIKKVAVEQGAVLCDVYAEWKKAYAAGVNVTELLANKLNHPLRGVHYFTAFMLLKCILDN